MDEKAISPMILSQLRNTAHPENLDVFVEIHFCNWCVVLSFFSSRACPKTTKFTFWFDRRRGHRSMFPLDAHIASAEGAGICLVLCETQPQFQLLVYILHMKLKHLPLYWSIFFMNHNYHGYFTNKTFGKELYLVKCGYRRMSSCSHSSRQCWGCICGAETANGAQCLLPFWGTSGDLSPCAGDNFPQP